MKTFWDFWAPFYDCAEKMNGRAYQQMLNTVKRMVPKGAVVLETAAGTGAISLFISKKAGHILCTDTSNQMLGIARKKVIRHKIKNITLKNRSIYNLREPDNSFDVVIAGQIFHLLDEPEKAAAELMRVARSMVILPISFTGNLHGLTRLIVSLYRLLGFAPRVELTSEEYPSFLQAIGFKNCRYLFIKGSIPMAVAVWKK